MPKWAGNVKATVCSISYSTFFASSFTGFLKPWREGLIEDVLLRLRGTSSLTLCALSDCGSLHSFPPAARGSFADDYFFLFFFLTIISSSWILCHVFQFHISPFSVQELNYVFLRSRNNQFILKLHDKIFQILHLPTYCFNAWQ